MRPLYETQAHLSVEQKIADRLRLRANCSMIKLPIRYHLDYAVERDKRIIGFAEIKTTKYQVETHIGYGGFKMSFAKWCHAEQMSRLSKLPFILLVGFPDAVRYIQTKEFDHDGLVWWGRADRADSQDMEPAIILDLSRFKEL